MNSVYVKQDGRRRERIRFTEIMRRVVAICLVTLLVVGAVGLSAAEPIKRIQGIVKEVGEGFLLLVPDDQSGTLRFLLRWKARFIPPKLPLDGDRVLIFYKDKPEGSIIYGINYLDAPESGEPPNSDDSLRGHISK